MTTASPVVEGTCDGRFTRLKQRFIENFTTFGETGAALAITLDNRPVVDIWAGHADRARTRPWQRDTIVNVYSTTKGMTAACALRLVDQGRLDLDAPVARYWPEFARAGKETLPVHFLLSHRAGLPTVSEPLAPDAIYDWPTMTAVLAAQEPFWTPGTKHGYHAVTYGWLVGEVIRRITGKSVGSYFREEIARPLGIDCHIGLRPEEEARAAEFIPAPLPSAEELSMFAEILKDPQSLLARVFLNPPILPDAVNSHAWRVAEIPAANGHANARALARLYGALACGGAVDGIRIIGPRTLELAWAEQAAGPDAVIPLYTRLAHGFMLSTPTERMGPNPRAFGHGGMGGSMGFADPDVRLGFGYTMNEAHIGLWLIDPRVTALIETLYTCV